MVRAFTVNIAVEDESDFLDEFKEMTVDDFVEQLRDNLPFETDFDVKEITT